MEIEKRKFKLKSKFKPTGDQPRAIKNLVDGINKGKNMQTLLGVTGSGKTFTMANVIEKVQKPTLIIAHNKTLAAQLYEEMKEFFRRIGLSILFLIMIIISLRVICRLRISILRRTRQLILELSR